MGASVIIVYIRVVMTANGLRVNHYDFMALHSMWRIFYRVNVCQYRVEIIHMSKF